MFKIYLKQFIGMTAFTALLSLASSFSHAHEAAATMDADGTVAQFTGYAIVTCSIDDNGVPDNLVVAVEDLSPPVPGLLVSMQIIKDKSNLAANTTDLISGDGNASAPMVVHGGPGSYHILVNKTAAGARTFRVVFHCMTMNDIHTTTDIVVKQFQ